MPKNVESNRLLFKWRREKTNQLGDIRVTHNFASAKQSDSRPQKMLQNKAHIKNN